MRVFPKQIIIGVMAVAVTVLAATRGNAAFGLEADSLKTRVSNESSDTLACLKLGEDYASHGDYLKAKSVLLQATRLMPTNAEAFEQLGYVHDELWEYPEAAAALKEAVRLKSGNAKAYIKLATLELRLNHPQEGKDYLERALGYLKKAVVVKPDSVDARISLGMASLVFGEWQAAEDQAKALMKLDTSSAKKLLIVIAKSKAESEKQLSQLTQIVKHRPKDPKYRQELAYAYLHLKRYAEANTSFKVLAELSPTNVDAFNGIGLTSLELERYEDAIEAYKEVLRLMPDSPAAATNIGTAYFHLKDFDKSVEFFKLAIRIKPDLEYAYFGLGNALLARDHDIETQLSKTALLYDPDAPPKPFPFAMHFTIDAPTRHQEALAAFKETVRLMPDFAEAYRGIGIIYNNQHQYGKAVQAYQDAILHKPDFTEAYMELGIAYANMGDDYKAIEVFEEAVKLNTDFAEAYRSLGIMYSRIRQYHQAILAYKEVVRLIPRDGEAHFNLGVFYFMSGDRASALGERNILRDIDRGLASKLDNIVMKL
jgi:tetratricopeptide (TPR) repeat protein